MAAVLLLVFLFLQPSDGRLHCGLRSSVTGPGPASHYFYAGTIVSDANGSSLHPGLPKDRADVLCVLADFNFLHDFPEGRTVGPVFPNLGVFSHVTKTRPKPVELSLLVIFQFYDQQRQPL